MSVSASIMNIFMLSKRNLVDYKFLKVAGTMIVITIVSAFVGCFVCKLLKNALILSIAIGGSLTMICTLALIVLFNVADFKMILMRKKR